MASISHNKLNQTEIVNQALNFITTVKPQTRNVVNIDNIIPITNHDILSNTQGDHVPFSLTEKPDTLIYAVNMQNNSGFVLIASDSRVPALAIIDSGSFNSINEHPGFQLFLERSIPYIEKAKEEYDKMMDSAIHTPELLYYPGYDGGIHSSLCGTPVEQLRFTSKYYENVELISPLIKTNWNQTDPYNMQLPFCTSHPSTRRAVGCVNVALGMLFAYHEHPVTTPRGYSHNWKLLKSTNVATSANKTQIASLLQEIFWHHPSDPEHSNTGDESTSSNSGTYLRKTLPDFGYSKEGSWGPSNALNDYRSWEVHQSINRGRPVYIRGEDNAKNGHAWLLDGIMKTYLVYEVYKRLQYPKCNNIYEDVLVSRTTTPQPNDYIHCNWGWGGSYNGYFLEGVWNYEKPFVSKSTSSSELTNNVGIYSNIYPIR